VPQPAFEQIVRGKRNLDVLCDEHEHAYGGPGWTSEDPPHVRDPDPWQENAVRDMEDRT